MKAMKALFYLTRSTTVSLKVSALAKIDDFCSKYYVFALLVCLSTPILRKHRFLDKIRAQKRER